MWYTGIDIHVTLDINVSGGQAFIEGLQMAINPAYTTTVSLRDHSSEPTSFSVPTTEARFAAGEDDTDFAALMVATIAIINGVITRHNFTRTNRVSNVKFSALGQREEKFLVTYQDSVTLVPYSFELPCRDTTFATPDGTDEYTITAAPFAAYVSALQAYAVSPDGNPIVVLSIRLMGKNS